MSRFLNILAAAASVSVFGVLVWWGLSLSQLDPNDIPVIKKANGPARISPEEPGGKQADHQGLSVSEVQTAKGISKLVDEVYLAPKPYPLQAEDVAGLDTQKKPDSNMKMGQAPILKDKNFRILNEPISDTKAPKIDLIETKDMLLENKFAPKIRPKDLKLNSNSFFSNNIMAELGSYDVDVVATIQLENINKIHSEQLLNKELFIEKIEDGLKAKYILKVKSFIDFNDVESFCMALKKRETFCSPIIPR
jgi:hypothetical protein|tara:strand:- start:1079 stop:1828 length:750 start_codon:yes stop_codon:yes gene_type:complete